ncbi:hypothetical protein [Tateyamaria sp. Alg231-49]|uniref:hypothetical protein n=1 Tax=Tateyamaria sp. Alg231-49 TaxID=1922219 RepID=UPI001F182DCF|nr:hypothetical protein [Tateyamaria sp. Alg231-49]
MTAFLSSRIWKTFARQLVLHCQRPTQRWDRNRHFLMSRMKKNPQALGLRVAARGVQETGLAAVQAVEAPETEAMAPEATQGEKVQAEVVAAAPAAMTVAPVAAVAQAAAAKAAAAKAAAAKAAKAAGGMETMVVVTDLRVQVPVRGTAQTLMKTALKPDLCWALSKETGQWLNNGSENSDLPLSQRERAMLRVRRLRSLQKFAGVHGSFRTVVEDRPNHVEKLSGWPAPSC